jgi:uncharacterized protein YjbJ (UPF0337 family)
MREYDFLRVIGATILAAGVAVVSQDPSFRLLPWPVEATAPDEHYRDLMLILKQDQFADQYRALKGDLKKQWSQLTDEDVNELDVSSEGFFQRIEQRYGDRKDEIKKWVVDWLDRSVRG